MHIRATTSNIIEDGGRRHPQDKQSTVQKRIPQNKRTAIRWVIQGVERCLATTTTNEGVTGGDDKSYTRIIDASLVDALYLMTNNSYNQKDILDAEKRLEVIMADPTLFSIEVNERVIKATAMTGLVSLSLSLLNKVFLHNETNDNDDDNISMPSPMAYTAVMNALRKIGRLDRMEEIMIKLANVSRKVSKQTGIIVGVDIVSFNTYLAALCDAAVSGTPFTSSFSGDISNDKEFETFNFTSLVNSTTSTSSEKYLYKAINLLRGDTVRRQYALETDPDIYSYNQVLNAAAKCSTSLNSDNRIIQSIIASCIKGMNVRGIKPDILTYNARLQATLATSSDGEEAAIQLYNQILTDTNVTPDRYTINFMLMPFIHNGQCDEVWSMLTNFYKLNVEDNNSMVSSAFEAYLITLVDNGEIEFAREVFQSFFLKLPKKQQSKRMQLSRLVHVMDNDKSTKDDRISLMDTMKMKSISQRGVEVNTLLPPKTRHFNILLGGYSKAYQAVISKTGKSLNLVTSSKDGWSVSTATSTIIQNAFKLLDIMLNIGIPLDAFSVSSLMSLPYSSSEDITSLLVRVEPEMMTELNPAAYRSIISAYGKTGDASSAFYMFQEMHEKCRNQSRNVESWNAILGALAKGCEGNDRDKTLDIQNSYAARARQKILSQDREEGLLVSLVDGKTYFDASLFLLDTMRNGTVLAEGLTAPKPNSQAYCLVASALSGGSEVPRSSSDLALTLFRNAMTEHVAADGRFLNAVLRCFGDNIDGALDAWKREIGLAASAYERVSKKRGANVLAAFNGLMYVCGRAIRPDIATRIAYAMKKSGYEPTEVCMNSYLAGKRMTLDGVDNGKNVGLTNQYESALMLECTKYNLNDKRRVNDKKIRIIL
jgi:pentatricopeptide repeat protein